MSVCPNLTIMYGYYNTIFALDLKFINEYTNVMDVLTKMPGLRFLIQ
jgi:hypothetical protein